MVSSPNFLEAPKLTAGKKPYTGRFVCQDIQWAGDGSDLLGTFTITANELTDAADNRMLWTDQDVQRGIKPETVGAPRELCLADGYPDNRYVFSSENADDIVEKLLYGKKLYLSPLVWNLRPGGFSAYHDREKSALYLYEGKVHLPDSHHRQQAIIKATRIWREAPKEYPAFSGDKQFKVELYFLSREDEGNYFFDKNQRPTPTSKSKAYDLTTDDALSILAKQVISFSSALKGNVNRVTDRLSAGNSQVVTLSTLREMMNTFVSADELDPDELIGVAKVAAEFYDLLAEVRPELGTVSLVERRQVRRGLIVDAGVMMHGYAALMKLYNLDLAEQGTKKARSRWRERLLRIASTTEFRMGRWKGDFFDKRNPLWLKAGVEKPSKDGKSLTVINTGATRAECGRILRQLLTLDRASNDLTFLVGG
ncbi:MAG: hypothetical protein JNL14_19570 [Devosia sp.]|uniref:DNA sulfur modification protein DndB n=1 Tax=Devosia sp. TaxID=1871048 RepID=UPI001A5CC436|nr:DNA sulfur modification protein DndB [Devosia sp.]MBL8599942.1 hypothetical protein [Devosia sp.]